MNNTQHTPVIGMMSGTSLDGLDVCLAEFSENKNGWQYSIAAAETISYNEEWKLKLLKAENCQGAELMELHREYGKFLGEMVNRFIAKCVSGKKPLLVAAHGHTIFHRPEAGYTFQLGDGTTLAQTCGIPVVCDFRSGDVALGGQGAPLVPVGDKFLFGEYDTCLNLGGFANISFDEQEKRIAFDISPFNYVLNYLARRAGKDFDENGNLAAKGKIIPAVLQQLDDLAYYKLAPPKSLGREWVEHNIYPLLSPGDKTEDLLRTFCEHVSEKVAAWCRGRKQVLASGGGAYNDFFMQLLREKCNSSIIIPGRETVDFKEALVFAFLGLLRWENRINIFSSVTGAYRDSSGGEIFLP